MCYPSKDDVGKYVAIFWAIFNSGGLIGCLLSLSINFTDIAEGPATEQGSSLLPSTYYAFLSVMICGCALSLFVLPLESVTRTISDVRVNVGKKDAYMEEDQLSNGNAALLLAELTR